MDIFEHSAAVSNCIDLHTVKEFQIGTQTDTHTDIRTCWAASSQLKIFGAVRGQTYEIDDRLTQRHIDWHSLLLKQMSSDKIDILPDVYFFDHFALGIPTIQYDIWLWYISYLNYTETWIDVFNTETFTIYFV